jgi:hypothetical protein
MDETRPASVTIEDLAGGRVVEICPGKDLITGERSFKKVFSTEPTTLESDLLTVASSVYAADLLTMRRERELVTRSLKVEIPVVNLHSFLMIKDELEAALFLMSSDNWEVVFVSREGTPEGQRRWKDAEGVCLLFSGGLDSLAEATQLVKAPEPVILVSQGLSMSKPPKAIWFCPRCCCSPILYDSFSHPKTLMGPFPSRNSSTEKSPHAYQKAIHRLSDCVRQLVSCCRHH